MAHVHLAANGFKNFVSTRDWTLRVPVLMLLSTVPNSRRDRRLQPKHHPRSHMPTRKPLIPFSYLQY